MAADELGEKRQWGDSIKVYTRRKHIKRLANNAASGDATSAATSSDAIFNNQENVNNIQPSQTLENGNSLHDAANRTGVIKPVVTRIHDWVRIDLEGAISREEICELRRKLATELEEVRVLVKQLEAKEVELTSIYSNTTDAYCLSQHSENNVIERRDLMMANSEVVSVRQPKLRPFRPPSLSVMVNNGCASFMNNNFSGRSQLMRVNSDLNSVVTTQDYRPFRNSDVSVVDKSNHCHGFSEFLEKEKRTPKANQYYRNSDFLLANDRLPPESNRKVKPCSQRKHGGELVFALGIDRFRNQAFKNCSNLLQRLMKHKHGWVFNEPVNARVLGLHDYHDIIKHPMDLGTIKTRLAQYCYKSPSEFADDVRLTFCNAMTYNPKGQDVHVMAEQLSNIFEEKWAVINAEYNSAWTYDMIHYAGLPAPTSRKVVSAPLTSLPVLPKRNLGKFGYKLAPVDFRPKTCRTPAPKKPKAKDPNKRDMTADQKLKLRTNLQSLPSVKIDGIVEIIKRNNAIVSQHDDEIELDIDNVETETLWELDRFFTNYKKSLSKYKRRAELAQARAHQTILAPNLDSAVTVTAKEHKEEEMKVASNSPVQAEKQGDNLLSSSSSSSSDSGSSSRDSDSDSDSSSS